MRGVESNPTATQHPKATDAPPFPRSPSISSEPPPQTNFASFGHVPPTSLSAARSPSRRDSGASEHVVRNLTSRFYSASISDDGSGSDKGRPEQGRPAARLNGVGRSDDSEQLGAGGSESDHDLSRAASRPASVTSAWSGGAAWQGGGADDDSLGPCGWGGVITDPPDDAAAAAATAGDLVTNAFDPDDPDHCHHFERAYLRLVARQRAAAGGRARARGGGD